MIIDFKYVQEVQNNFCRALEGAKGINYLKDSFNVPMWLILSLQSELGEILNASKIHKIWDNSEVNKEHLLEELADFLAHIGNLANFLDIELALDIEEIQVTAVETTFNKLAYRITTLNWNKRRARYTLTGYIVPLFIELVYSLGFNLDELQEAYHFKMGENYLRFI